MDEFPKNAEDFYARRDDRTNRCTVEEGGFSSAHCVVTSDSSSIETFPGQVTLLAICNLLSRWCQRVSLLLPNTPCHPSIDVRSQPFSDIVLTQMYDADPFGAFERVERAPESVTSQLHYGGHFQVAAPQSLAVSASGWLASISGDGQLILPFSDDKNCLGAVAAACLGVSQMFKFAIGYPRSALISDGIFDLFEIRRVRNLSSITNHNYVSRPALGKLLMIGAGSVASATVYCVKLMNAQGELSLVDGDVVEIENFSRSPIFGKSTYSSPKVTALTGYLDGTEIVATPHRMWWDEFIREQSRDPNRFDVWLPLANEFGVRWSIQNNFPPLLIHASTTNNWGVNHGRHRFGFDDCLADRFPSDATQALCCSTSTVEVGNEQIDAALPFLSMFAGLLVAADLARLQLREYPQCPNFALVDFGGDLAEIQTWDKAPRRDCMCLKQSSNLHKRFNGNTKYFPITSTFKS